MKIKREKTNMELQNQKTQLIPSNNQEKDSKVCRTNIDEASFRYLQEIMTELESESEFLKISLFKLNSWIITQFYKKYFKAEKKQLIKEHFDRKEYLKKVVANLDNESGEEIVEKVRAALVRVKNPKRNHKKKKT